MVSKVEVFYEGWGVRRLWGTPIEVAGAAGRMAIAFELSEQALAKGVELSRLRLPLHDGPRLCTGFQAFDAGLPGRFTKRYPTAGACDHGPAAQEPWHSPSV